VILSRQIRLTWWCGSRTRHGWRSRKSSRPRRSSRTVSARPLHRSPLTAAAHTCPCGCRKSRPSWPELVVSIFASLHVTARRGRPHEGCDLSDPHAECCTALPVPQTASASALISASANALTSPRSRSGAGRLEMLAQQVGPVHTLGAVIALVFFERAQPSQTISAR
jgi:hypothetical protein